MNVLVDTSDDLAALRPARQATLDEAMALIERERLHGLGCGLTDILLLATVRIEPGTSIWTLDRRLEALAIRHGVARARPA